MPNFESASSQIGIEQILERLHNLVTSEEGKRWLNAPLNVLDGRPPIDLIAKGEGGPCPSTSRAAGRRNPCLMPNSL